MFNKTVEVVVFVSFKEGGEGPLPGGLHYILIVVHIEVSRYGHYKLH